MSPPARSAPRISDRVARYLVAHIRKYHLQPGAPLPSEVQISTELGVSRGIIREAYRSLNMTGVLVAANGRAPRVGELDQHVFTQLFAHALNTQQVSPLEVLEIREPIEIRAAELAAVKRTERDAQALIAHAKALRAAGDRMEAVVKADIAFHEVLGRATGNLLFSTVAGALWASLEMSIRAGIVWRSRSELRRVADIHESIARHIAAGDAAGAGQQMTRHFEDARVGLTAPGRVVPSRPPARQRKRAPKL